MDKRTASEKPLNGRFIPVINCIRVLASIGGTKGETRPKEIGEICTHLRMSKGSAYRGIRDLWSIGLVEQSGRTLGNGNRIVSVWKASPQGKRVISLLMSRPWAIESISGGIMRHYDSDGVLIEESIK